MNNNIIMDLDNVPAELPTDLRRAIGEEKGGSEPVLVIMKVLFKTDASTHHGRFSIPEKQIRNNFLTLEEKAKIDNSEDIDAVLIEPCGHENHTILLARWNMSLVLRSGWNSVVNNQENGLQMDGKVMVQLWSFKCNTQLWFALVKVLDGDDHEDDTTGTIRD